MNKLRKIIFLILILPVVSCAGTGTKDFSSIRKKPNDQSSSLFFIRTLKYIAGGVNSEILVNGKSAGILASNEMIRFDVEPGVHVIEARGHGINALGIRNQSRQIKIKKTENLYFEIDFYAELFGGYFDIIKMTEKNWLSRKDKFDKRKKN